MRYELSKAEERLFTELRHANIMYELPAMPLYRVAVEHAFVKNETGPKIEALRRAARALLFDGKPFRMTKEFDKLLEW